MPKLAIVTGASTGIGYELAKCAARDGYDLLICADEPLVDAARAFENLGVEVQSVEADLATQEGVERLVAAAGARAVDILIANAGTGQGGAFLDQSPSSWRHVVETNINGTLLLVQKIADKMMARGEGRILVTGSIAGFVPGSFNAVYNGTKAFIDNFAKDGWDALLKGEAHVVSGLKNKLTVAAAHVAPASLMAEQHRKQAEPGTAE